MKKNIFLCIVLYCSFFLPKMVFAANQYGLEEDYLYYCEYHTQIYEGQNAIDVEKNEVYPFYVYVYDHGVELTQTIDEKEETRKYPSGVVPIIVPNSLGNNAFTAIKIVGTTDFRTVHHGNEISLSTDFSELFDKKSGTCPNLYLHKTTTLSDVGLGIITGVIVDKVYSGTIFGSSHSNVMISGKFHSGTTQVKPVTDGKKFTKTFHFSNDFEEEMNSREIKVSFYYNSNGEQCMEANGVSRCEKDARDIVIPLSTDNKGTIANRDEITLNVSCKDKSTVDALYGSNSFSSFQYTGPLNITVSKATYSNPILGALGGRNYKILITADDTEDDRNMIEGEGSGGGFGETGGSSSSTKPAELPSLVDTDFDVSKYCNQENVAKTLRFIGIILYIAKIFVPALIIIIGSFDLIKAMTAGKEDELVKKLPTLFKRIIAGIIIFFIPTIVDFFFNAIGLSKNSGYQNCMDCVLKPNSCKVDGK